MYHLSPYLLPPANKVAGGNVSLAYVCSYRVGIRGLMYPLEMDGEWLPTPATDT